MMNTLIFISVVGGCSVICYYAGWRNGVEDMRLRNEAFQRHPATQNQDKDQNKDLT